MGLRGGWLFALIGVLVTAAWPKTGTGQDEQTRRPPLREKVRTLVQQLDAPEFAAREAAERALKELGPDVLPLLPRDDSPNLSEEQRRRLRSVRAALEQQQKAAVLKASRVSLGPGAYTLQELLAELEKQTGNRLRDLRGELGQPVENPTIQVEWKDVPFWEALFEICRKAGLAIAYFNSTDSIGLVAGQQHEAPRAVNEAVIGMLSEVVLRQSFETGTRSTEIGLLIGWEPRIRVIRVRLDPAVKAIDDQGYRLVLRHGAPGGPAGLPTPVLESHPDAAQCFIQLPVLVPDVPVAGARSLAQVELPLELYLTGELRQLRLGPLVPGKTLEKMADGARVSVVRVAEDAGLWRVQLHVLYSEDTREPTTESFESWFLRNTVKLVRREDGKEFACNGGFNLLATGDRSFTIEYIFVDLPGDPRQYDLLYELPARPDWVKVSLRFKGVTLPVRSPQAEP